MNIFSVLSLTFILGCFCGIKFSAVNICMGLMLIAFVFLVKIILFKIKSMGNLYLAVIMLAFIIGASLGMFHHYNTFSKVANLYGTDITVKGRVSEVDDYNFVINTGNYCLSVNMFGEFEIYEDAVVKVTGRLNSFEVAQFNGDMDYRFYYALKGIVGKINPKSIEITGYEDKFSIWEVGDKVRKYISVRVNGYTYFDKAEGLMLALLTGNTDKLDEDLKENFRLTGISHLIAVSGLHMGIFLSFFLLISTRLRKNKFLHILFILALVVLYTVIIGERASILRAGIMAVISYVLFSMKRRSDGVMNLMIAGVIICILNPYYAVDAGFQLSFVVTLGIVLYTEFFKYKVVAVPFIAMLFVMPVAVYYYNTVSLDSVLVNLIVVPLVPTIILFGYIGCIFPLFGFISGVFASIIIYVADFFASMTFMHITVPSPHILHFVVFYLVCCAVYFFLDNYKIDQMLLMLFLAFVASVCIFAYDNIDIENYDLRFINNGSFYMEHVTTENGLEILVDCGYKASDYAVKTGIDKIYLVLITDDDSDRYSRLEDLCTKRDVKTILMPDSMKNNNLQLENSRVLYYNQDDYTFYVDGVGFKITYRDDMRCLLLSFYDDVIKVPLGDEITYIPSQRERGIVFCPMFVY